MENNEYNVHEVMKALFREGTTLTGNTQTGATLVTKEGTREVDRALLAELIARFYIIKQPNGAEWTFTNEGCYWSDPQHNQSHPRHPLRWPLREYLVEVLNAQSTLSRQMLVYANADAEFDQLIRARASQALLDKGQQALQAANYVLLTCQKRVEDALRFYALAMRDATQEERDEHTREQPGDVQPTRDVQGGDD
jgi:hypothetical protein